MLNYLNIFALEVLSARNHGAWLFAKANGLFVSFHMARLVFFIPLQCNIYNMCFSVSVFFIA